jgi:CPA2 family monovalent cation:H+ antiporter-2
MVKLATGWFSAARAGADRAGRVRAGATVMPRGEFSIVIASLGVGLHDGPRMQAVAAGFVLITALAGPVAARAADRVRPARGAGGD